MNQPLSGTTASAARTVVITGGNTGLGFACADAILQSPGGTPWHIVLACRDKIRA
jgi:NAD(P)-dependent dehydrogenase (short-subunit alcohol dehydrogenase family)